MIKTKKAHWSMTIILLATVFITACVTNQNRIPEKIEFPTSDYTIPSSADTTIFGPQGTRVFIGSGTFQFADGSPVKDSITIELREYYTKSDILLADLSTSSNGKLLETNGMIYIQAFSKKQKLEINPNKRIVVHFPKKPNDRRKMNLFYADETATDTSVANWKVDTINLVKRTLKLASYGWQHPEYGDSTGYNFIPKNYVDTGYYWNPLEFYIEAYNFSEGTKKEIESVLNVNSKPNFENWNNYGVECDVVISMDGFIKKPRINTNVSKATKQEMVQFLMNLPQLEPGTNKTNEIIERRGYLFIQGNNVIPLYKTDEEYAKSFDSKYSKFENSPIQNMNDAEVNYYVFSVSKLGWINCDRFINSEETINLLTQIPATPDTKLKMAFSDIDGILKANIVDGKYTFSNVPVGRRVTIIGIRNNEGHFSSAFNELIIKDTILESLNFQVTTLTDLRINLENI